jgi:hypothetical protein
VQPCLRGRIDDLTEANDDGLLTLLHDVEGTQNDEKDDEYDQYRQDCW